MTTSLSGVRILVVEDEALIAMLIEDVLAEAGATVLGPASTVGEALRLIKSAAEVSIDAVVLDLTLKGELASVVADQLVAVGIPFLFTTGVDRASLEPRHRAAPMLSKPFDCDELVLSIGAMIATASKVVGRKRHHIVASRRTALPKAIRYIWRRRPPRLPRQVQIAIHDLESAPEDSRRSSPASGPEAR